MTCNWPELTIDELKSSEKGSIAMGPFGSRIKAENFVKSGVPVLKGGNLHGAYIDDNECDYLTEEKADELKSSNAFEGDIVITHRGTIGQVSIIPKGATYNRYVVSQSQLKVSLDKEKVNPYYVNYFLRSRIGQHRLLSYASQVGVPAIAKASTSVKQIQVPCPPLAVQDEIVSFLQSLDHKLTVNNQINQSLEEMAQAIFKSWFVDFDPVKAKMNGAQPEGMDAATASLFPEKLVESELGLIPEGWEVGTLSDVAKYCSARTNTDTITLENYISTENMLAEKKGVTAASKLPTAKTVAAYKSGDILVSNIRPYFKKIWLAEGSGGRSNDVLGFESVSANSDSYLMNLLYQDTFFEYMTRTSKGAKMPRGDKTAIMNWEMAVPPVELRETFSAIVDKFYQLIPQNRAQNATLVSLRDTLLPKLLSGEIDLE
ncbi:restriction endonuclease subunit S, partial [Vibrio sp. 10N.222.48.A11]|uniref:restriction endonuclease subunit S n=1 Tax=Vibrio sp. 10N.222.48.A11 TaxID=3229603 RepID=UPI00354FFB8C